MRKRGCLRTTPADDDDDGPLPLCKPLLVGPGCRGFIEGQEGQSPAPRAPQRTAMTWLSDVSKSGGRMQCSQKCVFLTEWLQCER